MVIANQKSTIDPHTKKKKEFKHNTKDSHQITREKNKRKGRKKTYKNKSQIINKMAIRTYLSIIILNVNRLNVPTKRHRLVECIQNQDPCICCL